MVDGDYKMYVESAWVDGPSNTSNLIANFTFSKGSTSQSLTPADGTYLKSVSLNWVPTALGLEDNASDKGVFVFPNPSRGIIHVNFKNTLKVIRNEIFMPFF